MSKDKKIIKISDKLVKVNESISVYFYDNAYMLEATGRDEKDDWASVKLMCKTLSEVMEMMEEIDSLPKE